MKIKAAIIASVAALGAVLSRFHGGGYVSGFPKTIKNILWALPFAAAVYFLSDHPLAITLSLAVICFILCLLGKASGHGKHFDLGTWQQESDDERLTFIIKPLEDKMPVYWWDALGMAVIGFAAASGAVLAFAFINPLFSVIMAVAGILKAPAYMLGWALFPHNKGGIATEIGEYLTGAFAFGALALCLWGF